MTLFVVAGNRSEADAWIKANIEKRTKAGETALFWNDYFYVSDASRIKGFSNPRGVFVGSWRDRDDILDIVETLMVQSTNPNSSLGRIRKELKQKKHNKLIPVNGGWVSSQAVQDAAERLAMEIDQEVMRRVHQKINGGQ